MVEKGVTGRQSKHPGQPAGRKPTQTRGPLAWTSTIRWTATNEPVEIDDPAKQFRFRGWKSKSELEARVGVPSIRFTWNSDPIETSHANFAIIGEEANGKYYSS